MVYGIGTDVELEGTHECISPPSEVI